MSHARPERRHSFWPREHGAYVQLLGPLCCALAFVSPTLPAFALAAAACAAFLAHEPLLVLLGRRGARARANQGLTARWLLAGLGSWVVVVLGLAARDGALASALLVPIGLSVVAGLTVLSGGERSLPGQLLSAATLASFASPVLVASGRPLAEAVRFACGWLLVNVAATCAARAYVYRKRNGEAQLRWAAGLSVTITLGCTALFATGELGASCALATAPFAIIALLLASHALMPKSPKTLGWILTAANAIAFVVFGLSLRGLLPG